MSTLLTGRAGGPAETPEADFEPGHGPAATNCHHPPHELRVALVAAVWVWPGVLAGLLVAVFLPGLCDPYPAATAGGVLFGAAGAWLEAFD